LASGAAPRFAVDGAAAFFLLLAMGRGLARRDLAEFFIFWNKVERFGTTNVYNST
jgi:hypothetical protein